MVQLNVLTGPAGAGVFGARRTLVVARLRDEAPAADVDRVGRGVGLQALAAVGRGDTHIDGRVVDLVGLDLGVFFVKKIAASRK